MPTPERIVRSFALTLQYHKGKGKLKCHTVASPKAWEMGGYRGRVRGALNSRGFREQFKGRSYGVQVRDMNLITSLKRDSIASV